MNEAIPQTRDYDANEEQNLSGVLPFYSADSSLNISSCYETCKSCSKDTTMHCNCHKKQVSKLGITLFTPSPLSSNK